MKGKLNDYAVNGLVRKDGNDHALSLLGVAQPIRIGHSQNPCDEKLSI